MLSEQGRRAIACVEWLLLDLGRRVDPVPTTDVLRILFQPPENYRQDAMRYALLRELIHIRSHRVASNLTGWLGSDRAAVLDLAIRDCARRAVDARPLR